MVDAFLFSERKSLLALVIYIKTFEYICLSYLDLSDNPYQNFFAKKGGDGIFISIFHIYFDAQGQGKFCPSGNVDLKILGSVA